nr:metallophosphoesterase [Gemmatimonadales bacterium]
TSYGVTAGSMTYNLNDMAVKGHLPARETERAGTRFAEEGPELLRIMVMHQNLLRGGISRRMGLARWRAAWRQVMAAGTDLVLCGHDHEEGAGTLPNGVVVATSSTHTSRTRGHRPSACNVITADDESITVRHYLWEAALGLFQPGPEHAFARPRVADPATARG